MTYARTTVPSDTGSTLPEAHQPGESAAATLSRAVVAHLTPQVWVPTIDWDTNGLTATARITLAAAGVRVPVTLDWRADQFTLSIDGRRDPLRHSRLAHRAGHLATLVTDTTAEVVAELAEQQVAERLAATIIYGGLHVVCERRGADPTLLSHQCAQCGDVDFTAAAGGEITLVNHRCPVCRNGAAPSAPPAPPASGAGHRARRRRRQQSLQEELLDAGTLPVSRARPHQGPLADWPVHRLLQQVTQDRFTVWGGDLYEVLVDDHGYQRAVRPHPRDAELIRRLRHAGLVYVGLWLFADVDSRSCETHRLDLTRDGWRVLRRWTALHTSTAG
ncbi:MULTISPECIES: hypothetical protein [Actinosynnema]|uniref:hypothetical protein n=1 Tax=Actinosynnema TaxID=40566 RepID=UPI0020A39C8A|nr:hypothetical protein [Actinosynnema pretiosum]MCP2097491.1 hypothetical protein [Actinosynnema pretiosum]